MHVLSSFFPQVEVLINHLFSCPKHLNGSVSYLDDFTGNDGLHLTWMLKIEAVFSVQVNTLLDTRESFAGKIMTGWRIRFASYWVGLLSKNTCQFLVSLNA
jgi:hypothetical protein